MAIAYFAIKFTFFFSLVRSLVKYEPLQKHCLFLGILYTGGVAFLSYVFFQSYKEVVDWRAWGIWLGITLVISTIYFRLLVRFDEGIIFWLLVIAGIGVWLY